MTYAQAYEIASRFCPNSNFGFRWNTSGRTDCDLAWAIAEQYELSEANLAAFAARTVAGGFIPPDWEPAKGNTLAPIPEGQVYCYVCLEPVNAEPDDSGCGCHCPHCKTTL